MEIIRVGIYHEDEKFARALVMGLARESRRIHFVLMDRPDGCAGMDLVLSSTQMAESKSVQLVNSREGEQLDTYPYRIYQYKESRALIDDLLFVYFKLTERVLEYRGSCECTLAVFISDAGGSGTTMTSISVAKMVHRIYGSSILYLNLCPVDDSKKYLRTDEGFGLLKLLYYLDTEKKFPMDRFIVKTEDMDYVNTGVVNTHFSDMKSSLMRRFLKKVDAMGRYDYLFVDMGSYLSRENKGILENSELVVIVHNHQGKEPAGYYQTLSLEIMKKSEGARVLRIENLADDDWHEDAGEKLWISRDGDACRLDAEEGIFKIDLSRNYGIEIAAIAKKIVEDI